MSDSLRRALRSFLWGLVAMTGAIPAVAEAFDLPAGRVAQVIVVFNTAVAALTAIINSAEDRGVIPSLLKTPASPGEHPVPDPGP